MVPTAVVTGSLDHAGVTALTLKGGGFEVLLSVQVAVVNGLGAPEEIIAAARTQPPAWVAYPRIEPDLPFSDWRNEVICQSSLDS